MDVLCLDSPARVGTHLTLLASSGSGSSRATVRSSRLVRRMTPSPLC
jgi:hypothetical protein